MKIILLFLLLIFQFDLVFASNNDDATFRTLKGHIIGVNPPNSLSHCSNNINYGFIVKLSKERGEIPYASYGPLPDQPEELSDGSVDLTWSHGDPTAPEHEFRCIQYCDKSWGLDLDGLGLNLSEQERSQITQNLIKAKSDTKEISIEIYDNGEPLSGKCIKNLN